MSLRSYWEFLAEYLRAWRPRVALLAVLLLGSIGLQLLNPQILRYFIDTAARGGAMAALLGAAALFIGVALVTQALSVAATYVGEQVAWLATNTLRADLTQHCLDLDMPFHNARTPGEMIERIDGDVTALANFFSQFVLRVLGSGLLLVGVLVLLWREDWRIGAVLSLFALVALVVLGRVRGIAVSYFTASRAARADMFGFIEERLAALDDIRANGAGAYVMRRLHGWMQRNFKTARSADLRGFTLWVITNVLFTTGYVIALAMGAYLFRRGAITAGTVYLIFQYTDMLRRPLEQITDQLKDLQKATASIGRVRELYGIVRTIADGDGPPLPPGALDVEFDGVSFGYGAGEPVLRDLHFRLRPGTVLGLLGRTGSGKTTVTRLLFRLYDPEAGTIRLGGREIRATSLAELRARVAIVTQDVQLFHAAVRDNLTFFDRAIPDERILAVLREMGLWEWLAALPRGLDTELAPGGSGLSAGEAQLLAFSRALLKDPSVVVLDEASSRIDPATEAVIERAVDRLLVGRTGIVIAHRLHTVLRADEIIILEAGSIRERGSRAALQEQPDSYFAQLLQTGLQELLA